MVRITFQIPQRLLLASEACPEITSGAPRAETNPRHHLFPASHSVLQLLQPCHASVHLQHNRINQKKERRLFSQIEERKPLFSLEIAAQNLHYHPALISFELAFPSPGLSYHSFAERGKKTLFHPDVYRKDSNFPL